MYIMLYISICIFLYIIYVTLYDGQSYVRLCSNACADIQYNGDCRCYFNILNRAKLFVTT